MERFGEMIEKRQQPVRNRPAIGPSDWSALMLRAQRGDREAYRQLLVEITPYIRSLARRHGVLPSELEDAVQDVLLTLHAIRHTYDPKRPFGPWIVAIARRRIIDRVRRGRRATAHEVTFEPRHETFTAAEANLYEPSCDDGGLRQAIVRLPDRQRRAITLLKLREMSLKEAAVESGMSVAALKVASHRALKALRRMLGRG